MKTNGWLMLGLILATSALAQDNTNALPPIPVPVHAPATDAAPAPAPAKHKKHAAVPKRAPLNEPTVTLVPGPAQVSANDVNVRGQAGLKGEVVAHLNRGDIVTVISQINLDKPDVGEPVQWAKIALPASTHVWVNSKFIDENTKTVSARRLNLRAGPGENFSVLGVIEHGAAVNAVTTQGDWTQIDPPSDAYAFVAAMYLKQEMSATPAGTPPPVTEAAPAAAAPPVATSPPTQVVENPPVATPPPEAAPAAPPANPLTPVAAENAATAGNPPQTPRIVSHEGVVGPVASIIAPTAYELYDPDTRQEINYLYTTSTNLDISRYSGMRIIVTGEESLAERWKDTPLLTIQRIVVLDTNAIPKVYLPTPRQRG